MSTLSYQGNRLPLPVQCDMPASVAESLQCHLCTYSVGWRAKPETLCNHLANHHKIQGGALYNTPIGRAAREYEQKLHPKEISEVEGMYTSPCDNPLDIHCTTCNEDISKASSLFHFENFLLHPGLLDSAEVINSWECVKDGWKMWNGNEYMMMYEHRCDDRLVPMDATGFDTGDTSGSTMNSYYDEATDEVGLYGLPLPKPYPNSSAALSCRG